MLDWIKHVPNATFLKPRLLLSVRDVCTFFIDLIFVDFSCIVPSPSDLLCPELRSNKIARSGVYCLN